MKAKFIPKVRDVSSAETKLQRRIIRIKNRVRSAIASSLSHRLANQQQPNHSQMNHNYLKESHLLTENIHAQNFQNHKIKEIQVQINEEHITASNITTCSICSCVFNKDSELNHHLNIVCNQSNPKTLTKSKDQKPNLSQNIITQYNNVDKIQANSTERIQTDQEDNSEASLDYLEYDRPKKKIKALEFYQELTADNKHQKVSQKSIQSQVQAQISKNTKGDTIYWNQSFQKQAEQNLLASSLQETIHEKDVSDEAAQSKEFPSPEIALEIMNNSLEKQAVLIEKRQFDPFYETLYPLQRYFQNNHKIERQQARYRSQNKVLIRRIQEITQEIKQFSKIFFLYWDESTEVMFKYDINYRPIIPTFIFAINPFKQNSIKTLRQMSKDCLSKHKTYSEILNNFSDHFMGQCCPINTKQSTYLILWSDYFYDFLIKKMKKENVLKYTLKDHGYYKYIYQNTSLSKELYIKYPNFKNYIGYLHAYIYSHNRIDYCKICEFESPGGFMKLRATYHHKFCALEKKQLSGIDIRKNKFNKRLFSANLLNVYNIRNYIFFCPCSQLSFEMSAQMLLKHIQVHHESQFVKVQLYRMFKRE